MSVLLETTLGELVVDVFADDVPLAAKNFLKLCKTKYFNNVLFFNVQENFMVQSGDPTGTGRGGKSLYGQLYGAQANFFEDEIRPHLKHNKKGLVGMANSGPNTNVSQFYITTRGEDLEYLDGKHTIFGEVAEGLDVLDKINELYVDKDNRPYQDVRIKHTYVLDDPFPDPELLVVPPESPKRERPEEETVDVRLAADEKLDDDMEGRTEEEIEKSLREKEAKSRAVVLEMIGDLPDADVKPPEEVLFVCKLNPVTESSDLDMAFCRFGPCKSEVIRDFKTGDSLCFAFVEFTDPKHCEEAYFKMNNVLMDDRRIKVDFSQSVSKMWNKFARRGPWDKNSKDDNDPYAKKQNGGGSSKKSKFFSNGNGGGRRDLGGNLHLKPQKRAAADEFDLVDEDEGESRDSHRIAAHRDRDDGRHRRDDRRRSPHREDRSKRDRGSRRSVSRDRDSKRKSKRRSRSLSVERSSTRSREREARSSHRDRDQGHRRARSRSRERRDDRETSRRDSKRSRSRRRERDSGSSKRR